MKRLFAALLTAGRRNRGLAGGPHLHLRPREPNPVRLEDGRWPDGQVPVYTDLGDLGVLTNDRATKMVSFAATRVVERQDLQASEPRSRGDSLGAGPGRHRCRERHLRHRAWNGGGIDVIYDSDGSIMNGLLRAARPVRPGITNIDFVEADTPGDPRGLDGSERTGDPRDRSERNRLPGRRHARDGARAQPRAQPGERRRVEPATCTTRLSRKDAPRPGPGAERQPGRDHVPDQHPGAGRHAASPWEPSTDSTTSPRCRISTPLPAIPGIGERSAARSWIPPAPRSRASTSSRATSPIPSTISRSYISGQVSKGQAGPDGSFELNGLTPGARYAIYIDDLLIGAFSVPRLVVLPGAEEYCNGAMESGDAALDDHCAWTTIAAQPGAARHGEHHASTSTKAHPRSSPAPFIGSPSDITPDGSVVVGVSWAVPSSGGT